MTTGEVQRSMTSKIIPLVLAGVIVLAGCSGAPRVHDPAFWDSIAEEYEAGTQPFTMRYAETMVARHYVGPCGLVLAIAAGTGAASLPAAELGAEVVAIDFSQGMVERLRARGVPNIDVQQMDGQALTFPDASFDVTVSVFGVMLFPDWNQGLREMARVTKPGGTAAVLTWADPVGAGPHQVVARICRDLFPEVQYSRRRSGVATLSDPDRLSAAMIAAGFEKPTVETLTESYRFTVDRLFASKRWSQLLSPDQQQAVIAEARRRYGDSQEDSYLSAETDALLAIATPSSTER